MKKMIMIILAVSVAVFAQQKGTFTDSRDGKKYKTVKIGEQTWMAENLNFEMSGSICYNNNAVNCDTFGRLYSRESAWNACPVGWYLPPIATVEDGLKIAAKHLKTEYWWKDGNGTDSFGFSALPGGYRTQSDIGNGDFIEASNNGYWWIDADYEKNENNQNVSIGLVIRYDSDEVRYEQFPINSLLSVRCIRLDKSPISTFIDDRDGKEYKIVTIGNQTWMAENLNFSYKIQPKKQTEEKKGFFGRLAEGFTEASEKASAVGVCHGDNPANCDKYGRLYDWVTAMQLHSECKNTKKCSNNIKSNHRGICPEGWHIPSVEEWIKLVDDVGGGKNAGKHLKSKELGGTDKYDFSALLGGYGCPNGNANADNSSNNIGSYNGMGIHSGNPVGVFNRSNGCLNQTFFKGPNTDIFGAWWPTKEPLDGWATEIIYPVINKNWADIRLIRSLKSDLLSVRCIKD